MTPNDLDTVKVKNINMHATYTTEAQIFVCFALRGDVCRYCLIWGKVHRMTPKWPWHVKGQRYTYYMLHSQGLNFHPFFSMSRLGGNGDFLIPYCLQLTMQKLNY